MKSAASQLSLLDAIPPRPRLVRTPPIQFDAPAAPGSKSSERAAELVVDSTFRRASWRRILIALYKLPPHSALSREELSERTEIKQSSLCARLAELRVHWVERVEDACVSSSRVTVDGYRLSPAGRALLQEKSYTPREAAILKEWGQE